MSSTAYNLDGFLDERELERLANAFFAGPPSTGVSSTGTPSQSAAQQPLASQEFGYGAGANTDTPFRSSTPVPHSVTGSGISPSAIHQGNAVDLAHPQTSLPDPNGLGLGHVPGSTSGSGGASPGFVQANHILPFENEHTFHEQLRQALASVNVSGPSSQFAFTPKSIPDERAYYFSSGASGGQSVPPFNLNWVRNDFPILQERVNGRPLIWLDNAATTHKPQQVIDRLGYFYAHENSNIHRAAHTLAARATDAYEEARQKVQHFLNAASPNEIVFVRGTTEAINLVAQSWGDQYLQEGDEIIITHLEHHANIVPWQLLATKKGLKIKVIPVDDDGQVILEEYAKLLSPKTKLVSFTLVSNALGTVTPAKRIVELAHQAGARVLADGAQSVSHIRTDVQALDADWFVFSGHKIFGPTGIGVLYGKEDLLNQTQPWQGGGNMIKDVTFEHTQYHDSPSRFEAGTGNIADAVGLGAALDYVNKIGIDLIYQYEHYLLHYAINLLKDIPGLRLIGTAKDKTSVLSFVLAGYRTEEVGEALSKNGIAVRSGHHCAQPILRRFGVESTVRPSLAFYNTCTEIDTLVSTIWDLKQSGRR
ncbi:cysteine desulfurase / selenocysteine lyase [bacterium A37T11]|nr:cysteine desulfurase / selenocysteine lyase [bacterium A37T11]